MAAAKDCLRWQSHRSNTHNHCRQWLFPTRRPRRIFCCQHGPRLMQIRPNSSEKMTGDASCQEEADMLPWYQSKRFLLILSMFGPLLHLFPTCCLLGTHLPARTAIAKVTSMYQTRNGSSGRRFYSPLIRISILTP